MIEPVFNRTKIVATLGPATSSREVLTQIISAGIDVVRINASHGAHEDHQKAIDLVRDINREHGTTLPILFDLQGPKIRMGNMPEPYPIAEGDIVEFCTSIKDRVGNRLPMVLESFARDVKPGDHVLVDDGKVDLEVLDTNGVDVVRLRVVNGEAIGSRKGVNLPYVNLSVSSMSDKDRADLAFAVQNHVEWVALSFVRRPQDVLELKHLLKELGSEARVMAKIEKPEALDHLDDIIAVTDAVMVARGDLGVEIPTENVPIWQKRIVRKCNRAGKPVVVATQMLESMMEHPRPSRAEATDVSNAVFDGADAVMLSGETSVGKYPVQVVRTMQRIIAIAEEEDSLYQRFQELHKESDTYLSDAVCLTACKLAVDTDARALVSMTRSGYTAFQLSRHRPRAVIFIFTDNPNILNTLNLVWGVRALYYDGFEGTNESINDAIRILRERRLLDVGDVVINTASMPLKDRGRTNMVKISVVE
jgi:pyruvate kinase